MPSLHHEVAVEFFRNQPRLAWELLSRDSQLRLPESEARFESADFSQVSPTEYRADGVVTFLRVDDGSPALGIIVEVQLAPRERKRYSWPVYLTTLRARLECPVFLLVLAADDEVAHWSAQAIDLGGGSILPRVVGPADVPWVADPQEARANPELAVLSVMAHGQDSDFRRAARIACAAQQAVLGLDDDQAMLYSDLILTSLSEAARQELSTMIPAGYEFQSEFVRTFYRNTVLRGREEGRAEGHAEGHAQGHAEGHVEGRAAGRAEIVLKLLEARYGPLPPALVSQVTRLAPEELEEIALRSLSAHSLNEAVSRR